jgi:hypothetical protein
MELDGKQHKGVYSLADRWWFNILCFSKKIFKTKESAIEKFKELEPREIEKVYESHIRFLWKTEYVDDYDDGSYTIPVGGFFITNKKGKGAIDCWIIESKHHPDEFWV